MFLDISKAFDKVWRDGLILKLKNHGISGPLLALIESYLSNRKQRIVLNGKCSEWSSITVYINDLVDDLSSDAKLFADDTSLFTIVYDENIAAEQLNYDLKIISEWAYQCKLQFNPDKTKQAVQVIFSQKRIKPAHPILYFNENQVVTKQEQKHLGFSFGFWPNFPQPRKGKDYQCKKGYWCNPIPIKVCNERCPGSNV